MKGKLAKIISGKSKYDYLFICKPLSIEKISQEKIKKTWVSKNIMVSIICNSYKHKKYIHTALNGFLSQITQFPFEILIHDDASEDGTAEIILEYQKLYPDIIKPVIQKNNKYSQGISINYEYNYPRARGKYVALCEGDDYWIDPYKLQKQFIALESNPNINICAHSAYQISPSGEVHKMCFYTNREKIFSVNDVILGGGGFLPTASLFYRIEIITKTGEFFKKYGGFINGDVILQFLASIKGGVLFLPDPGCVYRQFTENSWSHRMQTEYDYNVMVKMKRIELYEKLDEFTNYEYNKYIKKRMKKLIFDFLTNPYIEKTKKELLLVRYDLSINKNYIIIISFYRKIKTLIKIMIKRFIGEKKN